MGSERPLRGYVVVRIDHDIDPGGQHVFTPVDVLWTTTAGPVSFAPPLAPGHVIAEVHVNDEFPAQTSHDMATTIEVMVPIREQQRIVSLDILFMTESASLGGVTLSDLARLGDTWFRGQVPADVLPMAEDDNEPEGSDPPYLLRSTSILARHGMTAEQMMTVDGRRVLTAREVVTSGPRWTLVGSSELQHTSTAAPYGGRTRDLAMDVAADGSWRCYLAAADGGVWFRRSTSRGWSALGDYARTRSPIDDANILSTGAVGARFGAAASGAQDTVVVGTGEPRASADAISGVGLRVSEDGGRTWVLVDGAIGEAGLRGASCYSVAADPNQVDQFFVAASNGVWRLAKPGSDWVCSRFVPSPVPAAIAAVGVGRNSPATDIVAYDDSGTTRLVIAFDLRANPASPVSAANPAVPTAIRFRHRGHPDADRVDRHVLRSHVPGLHRRRQRGVGPERRRQGLAAAHRRDELRGVLQLPGQRLDRAVVRRRRWRLRAGNRRGQAGPGRRRGRLRQGAPARRRVVQRDLPVDDEAQRDWSDRLRPRDRARVQDRPLRGREDPCRLPPRADRPDEPGLGGDRRRRLPQQVGGVRIGARLRPHQRRPRDAAVQLHRPRRQGRQPCRRRHAGQRHRPGRHDHDDHPQERRRWRGGSAAGHAHRVRRVHPRQAQPSGQRHLADGLQGRRLRLAIAVRSAHAGLGPVLRHRRAPVGSDVERQLARTPSTTASSGPSSAARSRSSSGVATCGTAPTTRTHGGPRWRWARPRPATRSSPSCPCAARSTC